MLVRDARGLAAQRPAAPCAAPPCGDGAVSRDRTEDLIFTKDLLCQSELKRHDASGPDSNRPVIITPLPRDSERAAPIW